jgi:hypothetical protein
MGLGGNAIFLMQHGLQVIGVDISFVAVGKAKSKIPSLMAVVADLKKFYIPERTFSVIIDFLYLQRDLWVPMMMGLKKDGVMIIECLLEDMLSIHPEINPQFLLQTGELEQEFLNCDYRKEMEILHNTLLAQISVPKTTYLTHFLPLQEPLVLPGSSFH